MTSTSSVLRRFGASALAVALTGALLVTAPSTGLAQEPSPDFTDLGETVHADAIRLVAEDGITRGYPDGTFRPREDVRRDQMATFLAAALRLETAPADFPDVPSDSVHAGAIGAIARAGITQGFGDGTYRPLGFVTRGQLATFLAAGLDLAEGSSTFTDVPSDYVHAPAIAALADADPPITAGFPDGTFRPNELVKRDQMAAFLARGIPLPREVEDPCPPVSAQAAHTSEVPAERSHDESQPLNQEDTELGGSEDISQLELPDVAESLGTNGLTTAPIAPSVDLGPAVPGTAFPISTALRSSDATLEAHTNDLPTSRGVRIDEEGEVTATTTIPRGRRTWAATHIDEDVYVGQWGVARDEQGNERHPNLFRYTTTDDGDRTAQAIATIPARGEFWALAADAQGRLWVGSRAHTGISLPTDQHVLHRVDPTTREVTEVRFRASGLPTPKPDVKTLAAVGDTLYVGTGQGAARLYRITPGDETLVTSTFDLTPHFIRSAIGVFALTANETDVALGTRASSGESARLVVLDPATGALRVNVELRGESRIDAVALDGNRVIATALSGRIFVAPIPRNGTVRTTTSATFDSPVVGQFHRFVEAVDATIIRGITNQGIVWTLETATGDERLTNLVDTGAPVAPGLPHSLHAGSRDVAVGANGAVSLRPLEAPDESRTVNIQGEAKALTSAPDGTTFTASYPNARLWRVPAGGEGGAEELRSWTQQFTRPADADYDTRTNRVHVIARDESNPRAESRPAPQANFQFRPSQLFSLPVAGTSTTPVQGTWITRTGEDGCPVSVEASDLLTGATSNGREVYIGDTRGGVQRVNAQTGAQQWYADAPEEDRYRKVANIALVDGELIVVRSGFLRARAGGEYGFRTTLTRMDPATGRTIERQLVRTTEGEDFATDRALTSGDVTLFPSRSVNRYWDRASRLYTATRHGTNDSFLGPFAALSAECDLFSFENTPSRLVRTPFALGGCA